MHYADPKFSVYNERVDYEARIVKHSEQPHSKRILVYSIENTKEFIPLEPNIFFISNEGVSLWKFNDEVIVFNKSFRFLKLSKYDELLEKFKSLGPIFSRFHESLTSLELNYRHLIFVTLNLASVLNEKKIDIVFFPFDSNHHIESCILEFAAELIDAKLIFTYNAVLGHRLIPQIQTKGFKSRKLINADINNYSLGSDLIGLIEKTVKNSSSKISHRWLPTVNINILLIILGHSKRSLTSRLTKSGRNKHIRNLKLVSMKEEISIYRSQVRALRYYSKLIKLGTSSTVASNSPRVIPGVPTLVLFAHYQPEATSFPEGGKWFNHIDILSYIRASGFDGRILYKEHPEILSSLKSIRKYPSRIGVFRDCNYYDQLQHLKCEFIDKVDIDADSYVAITITGTIAIERSLNNCKSIVAGIPWYLGMPGTISLESFFESQTARDKFLKIEKTAKDTAAYLRKIIDKKSLSPVFIQNSIGIRHEDHEILEFKKDIKKLFEFLCNFS